MDSFVLTGRLSKTRNEVIRDIENAGLIYYPRITNQHEPRYLVVGETVDNADTHKLDEARTRGIKIIGEDTLYKILHQQRTNPSKQKTLPSTISKASSSKTIAKLSDDIGKSVRGGGRSKEFSTEPKSKIVRKSSVQFQKEEAKPSSSHSSNLAKQTKSLKKQSVKPVLESSQGKSRVTQNRSYSSSMYQNVMGEEEEEEEDDDYLTEDATDDDSETINDDEDQLFESVSQDEKPTKSRGRSDSKLSKVHPKEFIILVPGNKKNQFTAIHVHKDVSAAVLQKYIKNPEGVHLVKHDDGKPIKWVADFAASHGMKLHNKKDFDY